MFFLKTFRSILVSLFLLFTLAASIYAQPSNANDTDLDEKNFGSLAGRVSFDPAGGANGADMFGIRVVLRRLNAGFADFTFDRTTSENGNFEFKHLRPGQYQVEIDRRTVPAAFPNPARKVSSVTINVQKETRVELNISRGAAVAGVVYLDANNDGRFDPAKDRPIGGASVVADGQTVTSGKDGAYSITNLSTGRQSLLVSWPGGQKSRVAFELDPGRIPRMVNIGTDDKSRIEPAAVVAAKPTPAPAANKPIMVAVVHPYFPAPPTGETYQRVLVSYQRAPEPLIKLTAESRPVNAPFQSTFVAPLPVVAFAATPMQMAASTHMRGHSTGDAAIDGYIVDSAKRYSIDPLLIYAQMGQESSYKKRALSTKGASGLMQLMPATARRMGVTDIYDPQQNIEGGVKYMRLLLDMFGDLNLALAGYNAGEGAVVKYGNQIPPYNETQDYVRRISARYRSMSAPTVARTKFTAPAESQRPLMDPPAIEGR